MCGFLLKPVLGDEVGNKDLPVVLVVVFSPILKLDE